MDFDLEGYVDSIIQARNTHEQIEHIWLYGFYHIINNSILDFNKVNDYLLNRLNSYPNFTKFSSSVQIFRLIEALLRGSDFFDKPFSIAKMPLFSERSRDNIPKLLEQLKRESSELDFFHVHLPVNEDYHLEFPLLKQKDVCKFIYTSCELCKDLEEHGFPEIFLRGSVYLPEDESEKSRGMMMYDNRVSVNHQTKETIRDSYEEMANFIFETRVS